MEFLDLIAFTMLIRDFGGAGELVIGVICSYFGLNGLVYVSYIFLDISYVYKKSVSIDASSNARHIFYIYLDVRNQDRRQGFWLVYCEIDYDK